MKFEEEQFNTICDYDGCFEQATFYHEELNVHLCTRHFIRVDICRDSCSRWCRLGHGCDGEC